MSREAIAEFLLKNNCLNGRMTINQCEELAKDIGFDKATFDIVGPLGRIKCKWLDAYYGMFEMIDPKEEGFVLTSQVMFIPNIHCENLEVPNET